MSDSDFSGRLLAPVMTRPRRPLSNSASTLSCSMRFSLRTMMSGARSSMSRFRRLLRLMTRRYRSLRSDVAKRPPSSGTRGRSSGGVAGIDEALDDLQALDDLLRLQLRLGDREFIEQFLALAFEVEIHEHDLDRFCADAGGEGVLAIFVLRVEKLVLGEELVLLERGEARLKNDIALEVED